MRRSPAFYGRLPPEWLAWDGPCGYLSAMSQRMAMLLEQRPLSPSVNLLRFRVQGPDAFAFAAGQWVNLNLPSGAAEHRRAYSIASAPGLGARGEFEVAVTRVEQGVLSPALHALLPGQEVTVDGPHGFFTRDRQAQTQAALFVGTGSGVAPLRAMILDACAHPSPELPKLTLLFGCRTQQDVLFAKGWADLCQQHSNLSVRVTLSRPDAGWAGLHGYVQTHLAAMLELQPVGHVYVCGLSPMVREVRAALKELGYGRGSVHTERFD